MRSIRCNAPHNLGILSACAYKVEAPLLIKSATSTLAKLIFIGRVILTRLYIFVMVHKVCQNITEMCLQSF